MSNPILSLHQIDPLIRRLGLRSLRQKNFVHRFKRTLALMNAILIASVFFVVYSLILVVGLFIRKHR